MPEIPGQPIQPQTSPVVSQSGGFNWKKVLVVVLIGAALIAIVVGAYFYLYGFKSPSTGNNQVEIKKATPSAEKASPCAQKDEPSDWTIYSNPAEKFCFKYPSSFSILQEYKNGIDVKSPDYQFKQTSLNSIELISGSSISVHTDEQYHTTLERQANMWCDGSPKIEGYTKVDGSRAIKFSCYQPWADANEFVVLFFKKNKAFSIRQEYHKDIQSFDESLITKIASTFKTF